MLLRRGRVEVLVELLVGYGAMSMRVVLRVVAWIWVVIFSLGGIYTVFLVAHGPVKGIVTLGISALLVLPGVVLLGLTKSKVPQD